MRRHAIVGGCAFAGGLLALAGILLAPALHPAAGRHGTAEEAKAMVEKAVAYLEAHGPEQAFAAFDDRSNRDFHRGELYVFVRTLDGNTIAHGANLVMIGQTDLHMADADGKPYNQEIIELARTAGSGWVHYRWPNPVGQEIEAKSTYVQRVGNYVVGAGVYEH
jgi:signal transduction histidine kinase